MIGNDPSKKRSFRADESISLGGVCQGSLPTSLPQRGKTARQCCGGTVAVRDHNVCARRTERASQRRLCSAECDCKVAAGRLGDNTLDTIGSLVLPKLCPRFPVHNIDQRCQF